MRRRMLVVRRQTQLEALGLLLPDRKHPYRKYYDRRQKIIDTMDTPIGRLFLRFVQESMMLTKDLASKWAQRTICIYSFFDIKSSRHDNPVQDLYIQIYSCTKVDRLLHKCVSHFIIPIRYTIAIQRGYSPFQTYHLKSAFPYSLHINANGELLSLALGP